MRSNRVIKIQINYALLLQPVLILLGSYDVYILVLLLLGLRVYIPPKRHNVSHSNFLCQMSKLLKLTWRFLYMTWKWSSIRGLGMSLNSSSLNSCPKYRFLKNGKFISAFYKLSFVIYTNCKLKSKFSSDVHCKCLQSPFFSFWTEHSNVKITQSTHHLDLSHLSSLWVLAVLLAKRQATEGVGEGDACALRLIL